MPAAPRPTSTRWPSTRPTTPMPGRLSKSSTGGSAPSSRARRGGHGPGDRVLARVLDRAGQAEDVGPGGAVHRHDVDELHAPLGDGAGLVQHDRGHAPRLLEHLGALDDDPELGAAARADHAARSAWRARAHRGRR